MYKFILFTQARSGNLSYSKEVMENSKNNSPKFIVSSVMLAIATTGVTMLATFPVKAETVCKVTDPTGTALNLRKQPNGQIIGTVENNTKVYIYEIVRDEKNRPWAKVGSEGRVLGWAFREFISCYQN